MNLRKLLLPLLALLAVQTAEAATRTVINLNDSGSGSLRDMIAASSSGDMITFSVTGTIALTGGELAIGRSLTIVGPAPALTVSGSDSSRVFNIHAGATVRISNLIISNGRANQSDAGGINNGGALTLNNCTLSANRAGVRGGGIYNGGVLTMDNSTVASSLAGSHGGGIYNDATLVMRNCTLSGNRCVGGNGGGIASDANGNLTLKNCTLSGNTAEALSSSGGVGGGIAQVGSLTILNTIIAENLATLEYPDISGAVNSQGFNLIGKIDGSSGWLGAGGGGVVKKDLVGTVATPLDPLLGQLQDNGGPTLTIAPLPGSAAIDAGDDSVLSSLATDQRGHPREVGAHVDIEAVEVGAVQFVVSNANDSGPGSLRQAVSDASPADADWITFAPSVVGVITLTGGELLISKGLSIYGPGANVLTISGNGASRIFHITSRSSFISGLRIANGHTSGAGGGILIDSYGYLYLDHCTVAGCYANGLGAGAAGGGGIALVGTSGLILNASTLSANTTPYYGGGLYLFNGPTVNMANCTVSGNRTLDGFNDDAWGGGIFVGNSSTLSVFACTVANNSSPTAAGGVYKGLSGTVTAGNSLIAGNSAPGAPDCKGTFVSNGYNLIGNASGSTGFGATGDQLNVNPLIGPLADNGGATFTHALLSASPAIDKGKSFGATTDQRGKPRPFDFPSIANASGGDGSDIGAFEVSPPRLSIVHAGSSVVVSWPASDTGYTLQAKPSLNSATAWADVSGTPTIVGGQYRVTSSVATATKVFRLRSP